MSTPLFQDIRIQHGTAAEADKARRESRASRREYAIDPSSPTAAQLSHAWGCPVAIVERLLKAEAAIKRLQDHVDFLVNKQLNP
jgi:hypothetical protein